MISSAILIAKMICVCTQTESNYARTKQTVATST